MASIVIIIPARGGSKRVPRKNLLPIGGKPLLQYTLDAVRGVSPPVAAYVSTEDSEIAALAQASAIGVIRRPDDLAADRSSTESVLLHALDVLEANGERYDWVMTLPPTNPFRGSKTIEEFIAECAHATADCIMSVSEDARDFWKRDKEGAFTRLFDGAPRSQQGRRQQGAVLFEENGCIYLTRVAALRKAVERKALAPILGESVTGKTVGHIDALDVNTPDDVKIAEAMVQSGMLQRPV